MSSWDLVVSRISQVGVLTAASRGLNSAGTEKKLSSRWGDHQLGRGEVSAMSDILEPLLRSPRLKRPGDPVGPLGQLAFWGQGA